MSRGCSETTSQSDKAPSAGQLVDLAARLQHRKAEI